VSFVPNPRSRSPLLSFLLGFHSALACLLLLPGLVNAGEFRLAPIFQEHMVLQRDQPLLLWGEGAPGEKVAVQLRDQTKVGTVEADGSWQVLMDPEKAGGPLSLEVKQGEKKIVFSDILIGDVWLCSGQSNMEWQVRRSSHAEQTIKEAHDPQIRLYAQPQRANYHPVSNMEDTGGKWVLCSPESVSNFSAVGYFFRQDLRKKLDVPIGLIDASVGATKIQAWMSREAQTILRAPSRLLKELGKTRAFSSRIPLPQRLPTESKSVLFAPSTASSSECISEKCKLKERGRLARLVRKTGETPSLP